MPKLSGISNEEYLEDLKRVYDIQGSISKNIYRQYGKYSPSTIQVRFGGWNQAVGLIGGQTNLRFVDREVPKEELIQDMIRVYQTNGKLTKELYDKEGKFYTSMVRRKFGNWNVALNELNIPTNCEIDIQEEDLINDLKRLYDENGYVSATTIKEYGKYSVEVYIRRFGMNIALEMAGVPINSRKDIESRELIDDIKLIYARYGYISQKLYDEVGNFNKTSIIRRIGWNNALNQAGIPISENGSSHGSRKTIKIFELLLREKAQKEKTFNWLRNPKTNARLRIDAFFENHGICVEYNGEQHYRETGYFGTLEEIQYRDSVKYKLIKENGYRLIIVRHDEIVTPSLIKEKIMCV